MSLAAGQAAALPHALEVFGACHTVPDDALGVGTLVLLGPKEPGFWPHVTASPEFQDGGADPLDRWSARIIGDVAAQCGGQPMFPFGTPARPFISWALRSGRAWSSPVVLLVHDRAGLMVSYRGAVLLPDVIALDPPVAKPCETCATKPCLTACPAGALDGDGYRLDACHAYLDTTAGADCMTSGCAVRRACPVSEAYGRTAAQSAFHMEQFHRSTS